MPRPSAIRPRPPVPEFEVVEADPAAEPEDALSLDDDADRPRKAVLLGDDDRPRRAALDDDEDDDRRRPRRRGDDRPRGGRRGVRDDFDDGYDDFDDYGPRNPYKPAAVGSLLVAIAFWIYLGVFGLLALVVLVGWAGGDPPEAVAVLAGLAGVGNWVTAGVGIGFLLAGPKRARGVTIAAAVLAGVHFLIMCLVAAEIADKQRLASGLIPTNDGQVLYAFITLLPFIDTLLPLLFYSGKLGEGRLPGEYFVLVLGGGCELARLILLTLSVGSHGRAAKDYTAPDRAKAGVMTVSWVSGGAAVLVLVVVLMVVEGKMVKSARPLFGATLLLVFVGYSLMLIFPALAAHAARAALGRKARQAAKADRGR